MTPALQTYFQAEKKASMLFLGVGILTCWIGGSSFLEAAGPFYIGLALPLIGVGIIQIAIGATVLRRTDDQLNELEALLQNNSTAFRASETQRMDAVMRNFVKYRWVEVAFILIGALLLLWQREFVFTRGLGFGLLAQGTITLIGDYFAEKRGRRYQTFLTQTEKNSGSG